MYHLKKISAAKAKTLAEKLSAVQGVQEAVVLADEGLVILKVDIQPGWDEAAVLRLIGE
jgi:hypothetical protein